MAAESNISALLAFDGGDDRRRVAATAAAMCSADFVARARVKIGFSSLNRVVVVPTQAAAAANDGYKRQFLVRRVRARAKKRASRIRAATSERMAALLIWSVC